MLKINPFNNDEITLFGSVSSNGWGVPQLGLDGKLYAPPDKQRSMLVIDPGSSAMRRNFKQSTILSPLIN